jgi:hypothetical protein
VLWTLSTRRASDSERLKWIQKGPRGARVSLARTGSFNEGMSGCGARGDPEPDAKVIAPEPEAGELRARDGGAARFPFGYAVLADIKHVPRELRASGQFIV